MVFEYLLFGIAIGTHQHVVEPLTGKAPKQIAYLSIRRFLQNAFLDASSKILQRKHDNRSGALTGVVRGNRFKKMGSSLF
jgi:hypothetical protein